MVVHFGYLTATEKVAIVQMFVDGVRVQQNNMYWFIGSLKNVNRCSEEIKAENRR